MHHKYRLLISIKFIVGFMGIIMLALAGLPAAATPLRQFPTDSVTLFSDPPPADALGQASDVTWLSDSIMDPDPNWRAPTFNASGWLNAYPAAVSPSWGAPLGGGTAADFIWGGMPGTEIGGRYQIPNSPAPQFLFIRKNFCIPINAAVNSIQAATPLQLQVASTPGNASVYYNGADIALNVPGQEDGTFHALPVDPTLVENVRRVGRNTLALRLYDEVADTLAGVAYHLQFTYTLDPNAITLNASPASGMALIGDPVTFSQSNTGLSGDAPYTFAWDFGDGTTSTDSAPVKMFTVPGTYTITLTIVDSLGCPSAPITLQYTVLAPTPTSTPTLTPTPTAPPPTNTPPPPPPRDTPAPPPADTPAPAQPTATPTPTITPTPVMPILLPATGHSPLTILSRIILILGCLALAMGIWKHLRGSPMR